MGFIAFYSYGFVCVCVCVGVCVVLCVFFSSPRCLLLLTCHIFRQLVLFLFCSYRMLMRGIWVFGLPYLLCPVAFGLFGFVAWDVVVVKLYVI